MSTSATQEATNSERAAIWRVTVTKGLRQTGTATVEDPGGPAPPPLFLNQAEARRAQKNFFETAPPLISGSRWPAPLPPPLCEGLNPLLSYVAFYPKSFLTKGHNTEKAEICSFSFWILFFAIDQLIEIPKFTFLFREKKPSILPERVHLCILTQWTKFSRN